MQHSIKLIAEMRSEISHKRCDPNPFDAESFISFAAENKEKYHLIENGDDLLVSSWYSADLLNDYKDFIEQQKINERQDKTKGNL